MNGYEEAAREMFTRLRGGQPYWEAMDAVCLLYQTDQSLVRAEFDRLRANSKKAIAKRAGQQTLNI